MSSVGPGVSAGSAMSASLPQVDVRAKRTHEREHGQHSAARQTADEQGERRGGDERATGALAPEMLSPPVFGAGVVVLGQRCSHETIVLFISGDLTLERRHHGNPRLPPGACPVGTLRHMIPGAPVRSPWREVGAIEGFTYHWPRGDEVWKPMILYETWRHRAPIRLAIGSPDSRLTLYGRDRGWTSVWQVRRNRAVRQLANFLETDDFAATGDRAAIISGKDGRPRLGFSPGEEGLLPEVYRHMRIEVHRDRLEGRGAKNRLIVVASEQETDVMLEHGLAHLVLRS